MYENFAKIYDKMMEYQEYPLWVDLIKHLTNEKTVNNVLDMGCGTGELAILLDDAGYQVTGVDISEEMLIIARDKAINNGKKIDFINDDMRSFKTDKKFDLITCFFDTINHLLTVEDLEIALKNLYENLYDGGILIYDIVNREFMNEMFPGGVYVDEREDMTVFWAHEYDKYDDIDYIDTQFFVKRDDGLYEKIEETFDKKIFPLDIIKEISLKVGFSEINIIDNNEIVGKRKIIKLIK